MTHTSNHIISCVLSAFLLAGSTGALAVPAGAAANASIGDVNADSYVNAKDAAEVLIAAAVTGTGTDSPLTAVQITAADVNTDGSANAADAERILAFASYYGVGGKMTAQQFFAQPAAQKLVYEKQVLSDLRGVSNARQMGGYINRDGRAIKQNVLIRSGSLAHAIDSAKDALVNKYHVSDVMDFRYERELNPKTTDPEIEGITHHSVAMSPTGNIGKHFAEHPEDFEKLQQLQQQAGKTGDSTELSIFQAELGMVNTDAFIKYFESDEAAACYSEAFKILLNKPEGSAVLFHCSAGKDRTGMVAMLLLSALDFDRDVIVQDYMLSNDGNAAKIEKLSEAAHAYTSDEALLYQIMYTECVYPEVIEKIMDDLNAEYGSVKEYLRKKVGLTDADFEKLQELYLED